MGIWRRLYGFQTLDRIDPGITLGNMKIPAIYRADKIEKNWRIRQEEISSIQNQIWKIVIAS